MKILIFVFLFLFLVLMAGCQSFKSYHDSLIDTSLVSELPTLIGNLVGGVVGIPFIILTSPTSYLLYPADEDGDDFEKQKQQQVDFALTPVYALSYAGGILLGTPFFPLGLIFPRDTAAQQPKIKDKNKQASHDN